MPGFAAGQVGQQTYQQDYGLQGGFQQDMLTKQDRALESGALPDEAALLKVVELVNRELSQGSLQYARLTPADLKDCVQSGGIVFKNRDAYEKYVTRPKEMREVLTEEEARQVFDFLKNQADIPFRYPEDGCYARAHEMARLLELNGISSRKVFVFGNLSVKTPNAARGKVSWWYHVAPYVRVRQADGTVVEKVVDPSLFSDGARSVAEWTGTQVAESKESCVQVEPKKTMGVLGCRYYFTSRFQYEPWPEDPEPSKWENYDLENAEQTMRGYRGIVKDRQQARKREAEGRQ